MAEESTAVAEPAAEPLSAPIRPEARAALDSLGSRIFGENAPDPAPPGDPDGGKPPEGGSADPVAPPVVAKAADPSLPPDSLLDELAGATTEKKPAEAKLPSVDEVFPESAMEGMSEKSKANWKSARPQYEAMHKRVVELEEAVKKAPQPDETAQARISELEGRLGEMSKAVEEVSLQRHPAFIAQFEKPLADLRSSAAGIVKDAGLDADALGRVLALTGNERIKALDTITEGIESPSLRRKLERTVEEIEVKEVERAKVLSDVSGNLARLTNQQKIAQHQAMQQHEKALNEMIDGVTNYFAKDKKLVWFQKGEGADHEKWNSDMESDDKEIRELATRTDDQGKLLAAIALGVKAPRIHAAFVSMRARALAAEKKLAERDAASPDLRSGGGNGSGAPVDEVKGDDFETDSILSRLRRSRT